MSNACKNSTPPSSSGHTALLLPFTPLHPTSLNSSPSEPRKLTIEEAAQYRFYERVSKGIMTLMQHGYSRRRAKDIVCGELAQAGLLRRRSDQDRGGTGVSDDEVFQAMKTHGLGLEETTTALVISNTFERIKSQKRISTDQAMDYLSSKITTMKLLAHIEGRDQKQFGILSDDHPDCTALLNGKPYVMKKQCDRPDTSVVVPAVVPGGSVEAESTFTTATSIESNLNQPSTPQSTEANATVFRSTSTTTNSVSEVSPPTIPCSPKITKTDAKPIQPSPSQQSSNDSMNLPTATTSTNAKEDKNNSAQTNNNTSATKQCSMKSTTTKLKRSNSIRGKRTRLASTALDEHAQELLSSSQSAGNKRPRLDSV